MAGAAARDAIALRVDFDLAQAPAAELLPTLALLQRWCGPTPASPVFLQVTRAQLAELLVAAHELPVLFAAGKPTVPLAWEEGRIPGVSEFAAQAPVPPVVTAAPRPSASANRRPAAISAQETPVLVDGSEHFLALTLPSREHPSYEPLRELVKSHGFILEPSNRRWWLRDRHKTLGFLARHGPRLRGEFGGRFTPNFERNCARVVGATVGVEIGEEAGQHTVTLSLQAGNVPEPALRDALAANRGYVEADGKIYLLDPEALGRLASAQQMLSNGAVSGPLRLRSTHRLGSVHLAAAQDVIEGLAPAFQPPEEWRRRAAALRDLAALEPAPVPEPLGAQLRPYQRVGIAWLWHLWRHGLGGVLADEMGLGKTLQALGLLSVIHAPGVGRPRTPSLVVVPASLLENWRREAARFVPGLRVQVHHGARRREAGPDLDSVDVVVTSYGTLVRDHEGFDGVEFASITADEAQHIKNRRTQNAAALRTLRSPARFVLTGTPLENSLEDLRSLFEFLLPGYLPTLPRDLGSGDRELHNQRLLAQTAPYILRRTKTAVAPELPPRIDQVLWCEFSASQGALYRSVQEQSERALLDLAGSGAGEESLRLAALTHLLRLRQICCDPRLLPGTATAETPAESTKLEAFRELVAEALDDGHRLLVFSQFTSFLRLIRADLESQSIPSCYLDGSMPVAARQAEVDRFQGSGQVPIFLLSLKAGGTGLNLTGADTVVHLDPWWNPAAEAQATDRAHRIGQTRSVTAYKLIVAGTVEEKVLNLQESKRALLAGVFNASDALAANLSLRDLRDLLA